VNLLCSSQAAICRSQPSGTGLELSIGAHVVTQHSEQINVENGPGEGNAFRVAPPYQHTDHATTVQAQ
jgi:signal transduction histidine kinase